MTISWGGRSEQLRGRPFERAETSQALAAFADARVIFDATGRDHEALRCETRLAVALHYAGTTAAARTNRGLVDAYRQMEDQQSNAQWSVVRLLDNLHEAGEHHECLQAAEDLYGCLARRIHRRGSLVSGVPDCTRACA